MKSYSVGVLLALALGALVHTSLSIWTPATAAYRVETSVYYEPLRALGFWVEDPEYGLVWYPAQRPRGWSPYAEGRWIYTVEYGWYWDSSEPWGWATYHYGRWAVSSRYGWVWVPDDQWGPAWVEWRYGDGYVGWAPMGPDAQWSGGGYYYSATYYESPSYRRNWIFVEQSHFANSDAGKYRAPPSQNDALIAASVRSTNYAKVKDRIVNRSVNVAKISAATGAKIKATPVSVVSDVSARGTATSAGRVQIYRPRAASVEAKSAVPLNLDAPAPDLNARINAYEGSTVGRVPDVDANGGGSLSGSLGSRGVDGGGGGSIGLGGGGGLGGGLGGGGSGGGIGLGGAGGLRIGR